MTSEQADHERDLRKHDWQTYQGVAIDTWSPLNEIRGTRKPFAFPISIEATSQGFRVTYGVQVNSSLSYTDACNELGAAIMHALYCDGALGENKDNCDD
jgi:hypothetical protein